MGLKEWAIQVLLNIFNNINKQDIVNFIQNNGDLTELIKKNIYAHANSIIKTLLRIFWDDIESIITDTDKVIEILVKARPDLKDVFKDQKAKLWLYENLKKLYAFLYDYTWR